MSAFTSDERLRAEQITSADNGWNHLVRFAFCKRDDTLDEAIRRLGVLRSS